VVISGRTRSTLKDALKQVKAESVAVRRAQKDQVAKPPPRSEDGTGASTCS
jgi:hypothetical protein